MLSLADVAYFVIDDKLVDREAARVKGKLLVDLGARAARRGRGQPENAARFRGWIGG